MEEKEPQFQTIEEAIEFHLARMPKLEATQTRLEHLRQLLLVQKARFDFDPERSKAWNVGQHAYIAGKLACIELLLASGHVVTG